MGALKTVNFTYLGWAFFCLALYFIIYPFSLVLLCKANKLDVSFWDSYLVGGTEFFFNGITPFSSGGQPIQIYLLTKRGITAGKSTGVNLVNFITLLVASNLIALFSLFFYPRFSAHFPSGTTWMIVFGFVMNLVGLVMMVLISTCKFVRDLLKNILLLFCKIKFIGKHLTKCVPQFEEYCYNAQLVAKEIFTKPLPFIIAVIIKLISMIPYYVMPYFILKALNISIGADSIGLIILASGFAITAMAWVPTPGGSGGLEFAFKYIFISFITSEVVDVDTFGSTGMIIWRFLTYYLLMVMSFILYLIFKFKKYKNKEPDEIVDSIAEVKD